MAFPTQYSGEEYRIYTHDKRLLWVYTHGKSELQPIGHIIVFGTTFNITEHKQMEERLHAINQRLDKAQQIAKIGDFSWNVITGEATWSDSLYTLLKYNQDDVINFDKVNKEIHHPDDREIVNQWLMECVKSGGNKLSPKEYRLIRKDGKAIFVHTTGIIERNEDGSIMVFATVQDITERKQMEEPCNFVKQFKRILRKTDLPEIRFHDLRHTFATLSLQNGVPAKTIQKILGHSSIKVTLDTYSHVTEVMSLEAANKIGSILADSIKKNNPMK